MKPPASADMPWCIAEFSQWLGWILNAGMTVCETGSGGSTVFFARRVARLISFEHDEVWHAVVKTRLRELAQTPGGLMPAEGLDLRYCSRYPTAGLELARALPPLDLAFIDGRGRVRSVQSALPALKPGGWLILDDSNRERYAEARAAADAVSTVKIVFQSGEDQTTCWRKK